MIAPGSGCLCWRPGAGGLAAWDMPLTAGAPTRTMTAPIETMPTQTPRGHVNANMTTAERDVVSLGTVLLGGKDVRQKYHHTYILWPPSSVPKTQPKWNGGPLVLPAEPGTEHVVGGGKQKVPGPTAAPLGQLGGRARSVPGPWDATVSPAQAPLRPKSPVLQVSIFPDNLISGT